MRLIITTKSTQETQKIGRKLALFLEGGEVICLFGDLGGGKTTFTKGLGRGLLIKEEITSPTFIIFKSYPAQKKAKKLFLSHFDLYRIENKKDLEEINFQESFENKNNISIIEWAEKIRKFLPQKRLEIKFSFINRNTRKIIFFPKGKYYLKIIKKLKEVI